MLTLLHMLSQQFLIVQLRFQRAEHIYMYNKRTVPDKLMSQLLPLSLWISLLSLCKLISLHVTSNCHTCMMWNKQTLFTMTWWHCCTCQVSNLYSSAEVPKGWVHLFVQQSDSSRQPDITAEPHLSLWTVITELSLLNCHYWHQSRQQYAIVQLRLQRDKILYIYNK